MVLGTAQLGMNYGVVNYQGKPTLGEIFNILDFAWGNGVRYFDTAPGYKSEKFLGEFISNNGLENKAKILTKIPSLKKCFHIKFNDFSENYKRNQLIFSKPCTWEHRHIHFSKNIFHNQHMSFLEK